MESLRLFGKIEKRSKNKKKTLVRKQGCPKMKKIKAYGSKKTSKIDGRFFSVKKMFVCFFKSLNHPRSQTLSSLHF